jgi:staphyloferrin B synthase
VAAPGPVVLVAPGAPPRAIVAPVDVLDLLVGDGVWAGLPRLRRDLEDAVDKTAIALNAAAEAEAEVLASSPAPLIAWERLASLRDRPFLPTAAAKGGWDADAFRRYAPQFGAAFPLRWVAVPADRVRGSAADVASVVLNEDERRDLLRLVPNGHVALPAHPWQADEVLPRLGLCVDLGCELGQVRATASLRTVALLERPHVHLKLPLAVVSLGAMRSLPARYLRNGQRGTALLRAMASTDPVLARRMALCDEDRWWALKGDWFDDRLAHLGCQLRIYPTGTTLVPLAALAVVAPSERIPAAELLGPGDAIEQLARRLAEVALACFARGAMPELHSQNVVLAIRDGAIERLVLRDLDTVRIHRPWLRAAGMPDPEYLLKPGRNTLVIDTPEELLGWFQALGIELGLGAVIATRAEVGDLAEEELWESARRGIERALDGLGRTGAAAMARTELLEADTWPVKQAVTPLLEAEEVDTGMPASWGRGPNPLRVGMEAVA